MEITCLTVGAAAEVVHLLLGAGLPLGSAFRMVNPYPSEMPIRLAIAVILPTWLIDQLQAIPDTTIMLSVPLVPPSAQSALLGQNWRVEL